MERAKTDPEVAKWLRIISNRKDLRVKLLEVDEKKREHIFITVNALFLDPDGMNMAGQTRIDDLVEQVPSIAAVFENGPKIKTEIPKCLKMRSFSVTGLSLAALLEIGKKLIAHGVFIGEYAVQPFFSLVFGTFELFDSSLGLLIDHATSRTPKGYCMDETNNGGWASNDRFYVKGYFGYPFSFEKTELERTLGVAQHELEHCFDFALGIYTGEYRPTLANIVFSDEKEISRLKTVIDPDSVKSDGHKIAFLRIRNELMERLKLKNPSELEQVEREVLVSAARELLNNAYTETFGMSYDELIKSRSDIA